MNQNYKTELQFGLLTGLFSFLWLLGEYFLGLHSKYIDYQPVITNFALIIPIIIFPLGIKAKRKLDYNGHITFWQALQAGMVMSVIWGALSVMGVFIYYKTINPGWYDFVIAHYKAVGPSRGMNAKEAEEYAKMYFSMKSYMSQALFGSIAAGGFISLIAARLLRTKTKY